MLSFLFIFNKWIISTKHKYEPCLDQSHQSYFIEFGQKPGSLKQNHLSSPEEEFLLGEDTATRSEQVSEWKDF